VSRHLQQAAACAGKTFHDLRELVKAKPEPADGSPKPMRPNGRSAFVSYFGEGALVVVDGKGDTTFESREIIW